MRDIDGLYYITHIANLVSILRQGIYSHDQVRKRRIQATRVYDEDVMARRGIISTGKRESLWEYVNLYFQPRNAMMYRLTRQFPGQIVLVKVRLGLTMEELRRRDIWIADGNAASGSTKFSMVSAEAIQIVRENIDRESWNADDEDVKSEQKREMMAECLVPVHVGPRHFATIITPNQQVADQVRRVTSLPVTIDTYMFFG